MDIFSALWLADYVGAFLNSGGKGLYYFHYTPLQMEHGCNDSPGTFGMFTVDANYQVQQYLPQYFAAQLINLEWIKPGKEEHVLFPAKSDILDGAGHQLLTAYALERPDGEWSLLIVNRDQFTAHQVQIVFHDQAGHSRSSFRGPVAMSVFGREQYHWHPASTVFMAHSAQSGANPVFVNTKGFADPDGPALHRTENATSGLLYDVPAASLVVLRGKLGRIGND
jgi:hypothetical protein